MFADRKRVKQKTGETSVNGFRLETGGYFSMLAAKRGARTALAGAAVCENRGNGMHEIMR